MDKQQLIDYINRAPEKMLTIDNLMKVGGKTLTTYAATFGYM